MSTQAFRDLWATSADGLRLHARSYGDPSATSLAIVCLPGLARHCGDFHDLALALTVDGEPPRHVVALDYRGRGRSDRDPDPAHYTVQVETADLLTFLGTLDIGRALFVGTSRGGLITMGLAAARPDMVAGAVLNDIGPVIERVGLLRIQGYIGKLDRPADLNDGARQLRARFGQQFPNLTDEAWRHWAAQTWDEVDGRLDLNYDPALARTLDAIGPDTPIADLWALFDGLKHVPVLAIRGALTDLLSVETVQAMADRHPDFELVTVPDQGHAPFLTGPDLIGPILRFVARAEAGAGAGPA